MAEPTDEGLTSNGLRGMAWVLGFVALVCLVVVIYYPEPEGAVATPRAVFVWVMIGCFAGAFSAASAVLTALKSVEQRLAHRLDRDSAP